MKWFGARKKRCAILPRQGLFGVENQKALTFTWAHSLSCSLAISAAIEHGPSLSFFLFGNHHFYLEVLRIFFSGTKSTSSQSTPLHFFLQAAGTCNLFVNLKHFGGRQVLRFWVKVIYVYLLLAGKSSRRWSHYYRFVVLPTQACTFHPWRWILPSFHLSQPADSLVSPAWN